MSRFIPESNSLVHSFGSCDGAACFEPSTLALCPGAYSARQSFAKVEAKLAFRFRSDTLAALTQTADLIERREHSVGALETIF